jgi:hypothetical protein
MSRARTKRPELHIERGEGKKQKPAQRAPWNPVDRDVEKAGLLFGKVERGAYEDPPTFPGVQTFSIIGNSGECLRVVHDPAHRVSEDSITALRNWLDAEDPPATISLVHGP